MDGWIKLHRQIINNPMWTKEPFTRGQAWIDLLLITNHTDGYIRKQGMKIELKRGDCGWSEVELSERWMWSRGKVRRFINELESDRMVTKKTANERDKRTFVLTIDNYNTYQANEIDSDTGDDTSDGQATIQATDRRRYKNKNGKNEKKEKKLHIEEFSLPDFITPEVWDAFVEMRKSIKKPLTARASNLIITKLKKIRDQNADKPDDVLDQSTCNCWQDVYPVKKGDSLGTGTRKIPTRQESYKDQREREVDDEIEQINRRRRERAEKEAANG